MRVFDYTDYKRYVSDFIRALLIAMPEDVADRSRQNLPCQPVRSSPSSG